MCGVLWPVGVMYMLDQTIACTIACSSTYCDFPSGGRPQEEEEDVLCVPGNDLTLLRATPQRLYHFTGQVRREPGSSLHHISLSLSLPLSLSISLSLTRTHTHTTCIHVILLESSALTVSHIPQKSVGTDRELYLRHEVS